MSGVLEVTEAELILRGLDDLRDMVKQNHKTTDDKLDRALDDIDRNRGSIAKQFDLTRDQEKAIAKNSKDIAPLRVHVKNSNKVTLAVVLTAVTSVAGAIFVAFGERIVSVFTGSDG
jgi:lipid II:glycine glycyltransferase (peptidoglycan interpeptide bridge formation enzyme)